MYRLVVVRCFVVACYVAAAAYTVSFVVLELDRSRVGFKIPTFVSKGGEIYRDVSSRIKQASYPKKPVAIAEEAAAAVLPETSPSHESIWVTVLLLAIPVLPSTLRSAISMRLALHLVPPA